MSLINALKYRSARLHAVISRVDPTDLRAVRNQRIVLTSLSGGFSRLISVLTGLLTIPLTVKYLGPERFGMWMTMNSLAAFLTFADLGMGNGVLSAMATAKGSDDRERMRQIVSSGYVALTFIGLIMLVTLAIAYRFIEWDVLFNIHTLKAQSEAGPAAAVFISCLSLAIPLSLVQRVQAGLQWGFLANLWQAAASVLALGAVLAVIRAEGALPWLVVALVGIPVIVQVFNTVVFFSRFEPSIAPARAAANGKQAKAILKTGSLFLILQVTAAITYTSDSIVITQNLGASAVPEYAIPERLFALISSVMVLVLSPLWPAYGEAIARGDNAWVKRTLIRSIKIAGGVSAVFSLIIVFAAPVLLKVWVGTVVHPAFILLLGFGIWKIIETVGFTFAMCLNGLRLVRFQVVVACATAISTVLLKISFVKHFGVRGTVWATIICYTLFALIPFSFILRNHLAKRNYGLA